MLDGQLPSAVCGRQSVEEEEEEEGEIVKLRNGGRNGAKRDFKERRFYFESAFSVCYLIDEDILFFSSTWFAEFLS